MFIQVLIIHKGSHKKWTNISDLEAAVAIQTELTRNQWSGQVAPDLRMMPGPTSHHLNKQLVQIQKSTVFLVQYFWQVIGVTGILALRKSHTSIKVCFCM